MEGFGYDSLFDYHKVQTHAKEYVYQEINHCIFLTYTLQIEQTNQLHKIVVFFD